MCWIVIGNSARLVGSTWRTTAGILLHAFEPGTTVVRIGKAYRVYIAPKGIAEEIVGFNAAGGIEPHHGALMHLIPVSVLTCTPGNFVSSLKLCIVPVGIKPSLVALALDEVVFVGGVTLNTPVAIILISNSPALVDVLEVFAVLGIVEICQVPSLPNGTRVLINLVIEGELTSHGFPLVLHGAVRHVLEEVVVTGGDNEHEGGPTDDPGLVHVVFTFTILLEARGLPLEGFEEVFHL